MYICVHESMVDEESMVSVAGCFETKAEADEYCKVLNDQLAPLPVDGKPVKNMNAKWKAKDMDKYEYPSKYYDVDIQDWCEVMQPEAENEEKEAE